MTVSSLELVQVVYSTAKIKYSLLDSIHFSNKPSSNS